MSGRCCRRCCRWCADEETSVARQLLLLGVATGLSLVFLIIAGTEYGNWLPMINLAFVIISPMLVVISEALGTAPSWSGYDESKAAWANIGGCIFGAVLSSLFGLPILLLHNGAISQPVFGLWLASTVVTFIASVYYAVARSIARANS